jgi:hypothetical protein
LNYQVIAQSVEDIQDIENAPAISMGESRDQMRLLHMNAAAIQVWN